MAVLAIDTSSGIGVGVLAPEAPAVVLHDPRERQHAELLAMLVRSGLDQADVTPADVERVVVGTGPAPFTGLRAGIVAARAFAFARGVPVLGVPSFDAVAVGAVRRGLVQTGDDVVVLSDARRREVYWARYHVGPRGVEVTEVPQVVAPADALASGAWQGAVAVATAPITVLEASGSGDGRGETGFRLAADDAVPDMAAMAALALEREERSLEQSTAPVYLRRPDAVVPGASKRATA